MRPHKIVKASKEVVGVEVKNNDKETLGEIKEVMVDKESGRVAYIVLETGGLLGLGHKLFALPWNSISYDKGDACFLLNVDKEKIKNAPGFNDDQWPDMADREFGLAIFKHYGTKPYWE